MSASRSSLVEQMVEQQPWAADPTYQEGAILFCCKSNISYDEAELGGASDTAFSFSTGDYLQVVKIIDSDWWLARVFGGGATLGRMPAPTKFTEILKGHDSTDSKHKPVRRMSSFLSSSKGTDESMSEDEQTRRKRAAAQIGKNLLASPANKKAGAARIARPFPSRPVYDLAPKIRPLVFVGPSKLGCPVTDRMQQALINYLELTFEGVTSIAPVYTFGESKKMRTGGFRPLLTNAGVDESGRPDERPLADINKLVDRRDIMFTRQAATEQKIPIYQIDPEDVATLRYSTLMPVVIYIKISEGSVLTKLVKETGEGMHSLQAQLRGATTLTSMPTQRFDLVLNQSKLDHCCYELAAFVDMFLGESTYEPDAASLRAAPNLGVSGGGGRHSSAGGDVSLGEDGRLAI